MNTELPKEFEKYKHLLDYPFSYEEGEDCLTTTVRYFETMHGININNDYARFEGWEDQGLDLFVDNFRKENFRLVDLDMDDSFFRSLREGDVLLMSLRNFKGRGQAGSANHCAVWIEPRFILHNFYGRKSEIVKYRLRNSTTHILRHKDLVLEEKPIEKILYSDMLPSHKREQLIDAGALIS